MKLTTHSPNCVSAEVLKGSAEVLFSYKTPVALRVLAPIPIGGAKVLPGLYRTEENHSRTTNKHLGIFRQYCGREEYTAKLPQAFFDNL